MRLKRRYAILALVSAAALAAGGIGYAHDANVSSLTGTKITPSTLPLTTFKPVSLFVHTHTNYAHPGVKSQGGFAKTVTLLFDDDGKINLTGVPQCTANFPSSTELSQAWNTCCPGAGAAHNAYLSPPTAVSGTASTAPPANFDGCVLVFNGPTVNGNPTNVLFTAVNTVGTVNCANPGSNTAAETSVTLKGTITNAGVADFGKKLTVPNIDKLALPLDDFRATVKRGSVFTARCHDPNKILNVRGIFVYSNDPPPPPSDPQSTDTVNSTQPCTVG